MRYPDRCRWNDRFSYPVIGGLLLFLCACSVQKRVGRMADADMLHDPSFRSAHTGICVYDPAAGSYLYNYQSDKYFVPASNTKLFSFYAGLKYLGDSLIGIRYIETDTAFFIFPAGDPTLLHPDYSRQPVVDFLKKSGKPLYVVGSCWKDQALGSGWSWDDYNGDYMAERSPLPVYGNVLRWVQEKQQAQQPGMEPSPIVYSIPDMNWKVQFSTDSAEKHFFVRRHWDDNIFEITEGNEKYKAQDVPFITHGLGSAMELLPDTIGKTCRQIDKLPAQYAAIVPHIIHSQPVDSLFAPMMHRSDNFFAEQTLLMVSNETLGIMDDEKIIDTLLKADLKNLPQSPEWVDGSGLSRFNLFTPQDFVWLLNQLKNEFGMERMKHILPTGGTGTLRNYYKQDSGYVFAKTGSLSGVLCLSGYVYSKKNKLFIFSILVNNHHGSTAAIRKGFEKFITGLRNAF